MKELNDYTLM